MTSSFTPINKVDANMASSFSPTQLGILEFHWDQHAFMGRARPPSGRSKAIAQELSENGPQVTAQSVGRYYGARLAEAKGISKAPSPDRVMMKLTRTLQGRTPQTAKTPEQLQLLNESWDRDPYPTTGQTILLVHHTGLTKNQVQTWFSQKREKITRTGGALTSSNGPGKLRQEAVLFWQRYEYNPDRMVKGLTNGRIDHKTGIRKAFINYEDFEEFYDDAIRSIFPEDDPMEAWEYFGELTHEEFLEWLED